VGSTTGLDNMAKTEIIPCRESNPTMSGIGFCGVGNWNTTVLEMEFYGVGNRILQCEELNSGRSAHILVNMVLGRIFEL
jgi:hypothetical protein